MGEGGRDTSIQSKNENNTPEDIKDMNLINNIINTDLYKKELIEEEDLGLSEIKLDDMNFKKMNIGDMKVEELDNLDDIFDSGVTMSQVVAELKEKNPLSCKSMVLLRKNMTRETRYLPDYTLFSIEDRFVVGYGLDYKEYYRGLPGIFILDPNE